MQLDWQDLHHSQLTLKQLYAILELRNQVFIVEQQCPYQDIDNQDLENDYRHITAWHKEQLIAYARILTTSSTLIIGRVIIHPEYRGKSLGYQLLENTLKSCHSHWDNKQAIKLSAQAHLQQFYEKFNFKPISDIYAEDGIPHIDMHLATQGN